MNTLILWTFNNLILSTNSLSKCIKISVENLQICVDIQALRVKVSYLTLVIQNAN